jgi:hypothetical protein
MVLVGRGICRWTFGGRDVINHAGAAVLRLFADRTGLTNGSGWLSQSPAG